jgi:hypothetical protein
MSTAQRLFDACSGDTAQAAGVRRMIETAPGTNGRQRREGGGRVAPRPAARPLRVLQGGRRRRPDALIWAVLVLGSIAWFLAAIMLLFVALTWIWP